MGKVYHDYSCLLETFCRLKMLLIQSGVALEYFKDAKLFRQALKSDVPVHFCTDTALPAYQCR